MNGRTETEAGQARTPLVRLLNVSKNFGNVVAVHPVNLDIHKGDFFALLGPSGCGKTTLLRMIGGFLGPTTGTIEIGGTDVTRWGPERRKTNMVFQGYGLFPHMTVRQNIAYGLRLAKQPKKTIEEKVAGILNLVHLADFADRYPSNLSGGQQQRVALARALVMEPAVLLLDESLAALDLKLRKAMQEELRSLHRSIGGTFVFVTHDQGEAMALANRIAVMQDGRIVQQGPPEDIYSAPVTEFVARFIGDANIFRARRSGGRISLDNSNAFENAGRDGDVVVVVRPDNVRVRRQRPSTQIILSGRVSDKVFMGSHVRLTVVLHSGHEVTAHLLPAHAEELDIAEGETVHIGWDVDSCSVVDAK